jgi:hypothetical protein
MGLMVYFGKSRKSRSKNLWCTKENIDVVM